jgi:cellulose synthase/poly-beta-1,6-N-acetylglucosamine synthase-like glycosyltransferase
MLSVSICICAYNEEANIERTIRSVYHQRTDGFEIVDVIVVSSGSTDGTDGIVRALMNEFPSLKLIRQETRMGKNSAVNEFLNSKKGDISVLLNADNILRDENSLSFLISPFNDESVGMTGGHPVPTNDPKSLMGFVAHSVWSKHHHTSMIRPQMGELVAFRDTDIRLPTDMQSDEAIVKMELENRGYVSVYVPDAFILNRGPETVSDFIAQRTRVIVGEEFMRRKYGYSVPATNLRMRMAANFNVIRDVGVHPFRILFTLMLETISKCRAKAYVRGSGKDMSIWKRVESTKDLKKNK